MQLNECYIRACMCACASCVTRVDTSVGARVVRRGDDMCIDVHRQCATLNVPGAVLKLSGGISRLRHRDKKTIQGPVRACRATRRFLKNRKTSGRFPAIVLRVISRRCTVTLITAETRISWF